MDNINNFSYAKCDEYIRNMEEGKLQTQAGSTEEETLEVLKLLCSLVVFFTVFFS